MKRFLALTICILITTLVHAQIPKYTSTQVNNLKKDLAKTITLQNCLNVKKEYMYVVDFMKSTSSTQCPLNIVMTTLSITVAEIGKDVVTTYSTTSSQTLSSATCTKIDLNSLALFDGRGRSQTFGGFLNPTTGTLTTDVYLPKITVRTNIPMTPGTVSPPSGTNNTVFIGSARDTTGKYQVTAVLTMKRICHGLEGYTVLD
jgi:hypothetical protein